MAKYLVYYNVKKNNHSEIFNRKCKLVFNGCKYVLIEDC